MDKIAIISDIHANITALNAVLKDIEERKISHIYCLGDLVAKGVNPDIVIDIIKEKCEVVVRGNCDNAIGSERAKLKKFWSTEKIGEERRKYLANLPVMYEFYLSGQLVRLFHAAPQGLEYIFNPLYLNEGGRYENYELDSIEKLFENTEFIGKNKNDEVPDIVGYGHIHTPNLYRFKNKTVFNTGSVGSPNEMENDGKEDRTNSFSTLASYSILEGNLGSKELGPISITNVRVPYDIEKEIESLEKSDMPYKEKAIFCLRTASTNYEKE